MRTIGLDIGGANIKLACKDYDEIIYFPFWKRFSEFGTELKKIFEKYHPEKAGVVMTAELSDCFRSRREGTEFIADTIRRTFPIPIYFLDIIGNLKREIVNPEFFFASNWVASVRFLMAEGYSNFIFADMGSTTTDLIPVTERIEGGRTDYERLGRKELLYFGILRTPVFHILPEFDVPLVPEYFAITADVFTITGDISEEDYNCDTPDGREKSSGECMQRLARTVCLDVEGNEGYIMSIAEAVKEKILDKLRDALSELRFNYNIDRVLGCGKGEFLIEKAAEDSGLNYISLTTKYRFSETFPAYAVSRLVENEK
jgi:hypothetical protein